MSVENIPVWLCREDDKVHDWSYGSPGDPHCWFNGPRAHNSECGEYLLADPLVVYPSYLAPILATIARAGEGHLVLSYDSAREPSGWAGGSTFGSEAEASPMAGGAAYGLGETAKAALEQMAKDLRPRNENYAGDPDQEKQP